jgi:type VI protein secretion system component Hcp
VSIYVAWTNYDNVLLHGSGTATKLTNPFTKASVPPGSLTAVQSAGFGADQTLNIGSQSSGSGAGKVTFDDLVITKSTDQNSALHFTDLCSGTPWQYVDVYLVADANEGNPAVILEAYRFGLVAGHDYTRVLDGSLQPVETLNYEYGGVLYGVLTQNPNGTHGKFVYDGWNRVTNTKWDGSTIK